MLYYPIFILAGHSGALGRQRPEDLKLETIVACVVRSVSEAKATIDRMNSHPAHALSLLTDSPSWCDTPSALAFPFLALPPIWLFFLFFCFDEG